MVDVVVHVGLPRTGTTFLQREVFPKLEGVNLVGKDFFFDRFADDMVNLISREDLSWKNRFSCILRVKCLFPDARIICVRRDVDSWVGSAFNHFCYASDRESRCFEDWSLEYVSGELWFDDYFYLLQVLFRDVLFLDYDDLVGDPRGFIGSLCSFLGCGVPEYSNRFLNQSLSGNSIRLISWLKGWDVPVVFKRNVIDLLKFINDGGG